MTTGNEPNPLPELETAETADESWRDGFCAGMRYAYDQVLSLLAASRLPEEALLGAVPPVTGQTFSYLLPSLENFYHSDPNPAVVNRRFLSGEADYGVGWKLRGWPGSWRVSYVQSTGEVYAVNNDVGRVMVLGIVPADTRAKGEIYYHTLDRILDGWPERCGTPSGLSWVIARLREWAEEMGYDSRQERI